MTAGSKPLQVVEQFSPIVLPCSTKLDQFQWDAVAAKSSW
jgi:hypothetical protein